MQLGVIAEATGTQPRRIRTSAVYAGHMAIARLHGGPLDGQLLPLEDPQLDRMIVPYSETQVVYERKGSPENTGEGDGPTEAEFWFVESEDDIDPFSDTARDRR